MKKKILLIVVLLFSYVFVSCAMHDNKSSANSDITAELSSTDVIDNDSGSVSNDSEKPVSEVSIVITTSDPEISVEESGGPEESVDDSIPFEPPAERDTFSFETYQELLLALCSPDSEQYSMLRSDLADRELGLRFDSFLRAFTESGEKLLTPCLNGAAMTIGSEYDWQRIKLFSDELYDLPWIWYYCEYEGETVVVCISYPESIEGISISGSDDFRTIVSAIAPDAPLDTADYGNSANGNTISEMKIRLYDDVNVTALRYYMANSNRTHYRFLYNNCLVSIWAYKSGMELTDAFFGSFSLQPIE